MKYWMVCIGALLIFSGILCAAESSVVMKNLNEVTLSYLENDAAGAKTKAEILARVLKKQPTPDAALIVILDFLAGNDQADLQSAATLMQSRPDAWAIASMAFFSRNASLGTRLERRVLENNLQNYQNCVPHLTMPEALQWKTQAAQFTAWCQSDFKKKIDLPPLLSARLAKQNAPATPVAAAANSNTDAEDKLGSLDDKDEPKEADLNALLALTGDTLKKHREENYPDRPQSTGYLFDENSSSFQKYLQGLKDDTARNLEKRRYRYMSGMKPNLVATLERNSYTGTIKTKKGIVRGTLALANEKTFMVRPNRGKGRAFKWSEMDPWQFAKLMEHYGQQRSKVSGFGIPAQERNNHVAKQYMAAAICYDWYGNYDDAARVIQKLLKLNPNLAGVLDQFFLH